MISNEYIIQSLLVTTLTSKCCESKVALALHEQGMSQQNQRLTDDGLQDTSHLWPVSKSVYV